MSLGLDVTDRDTGDTGAADAYTATRSGAPALVGGLTTAALGAAGTALGAGAIAAPTAAVHVGWLIPLTGARFALDELGGLIMAVTGVVAVAAGIYTIGYARREQLPTFSVLLLPAFTASLLLVPAAASVSTFLLGWELMALTSLLLVLTDHHRVEARRAGLVYAVLTQLGFLALLVGLLVLVHAAGGAGFENLARAARNAGSGTRDAVFVLTIVGFGSKAGLVPLHAWLPRAHPEAPSPVSALMSAVMVAMGIYGLVRFDVQVLGPGPAWWGLVLLVLGGVSALFGALHASVANDLKRLLAYSTVENMGLVTLALGAALLLEHEGDRAIASVALTAALLHVVAHAAFKALGFLAAGAVLAATGVRDLDQLGGLVGPMPVTTTLFGIAALGAAGLPLGAGFAGEWLLLQALIHAPRRHGEHVEVLLDLALPLAVGAVALTAGLAVAAMVKAFGIGFLARPRSAAAAGAREGPPTMLVGMVLLGLGCAAAAVTPGLLGPALRRVVGTVLPGAAGPRLGNEFRLPGVAGSVSPGWLVAGLGAALLAALALGAVGRRRRPTPESAPLWACGATPPTVRMQYTATSFAQPLQRVFADVLRPSTDVEVSSAAESRYVLERLRVRTRLADAVERYGYLPVARGVLRWAAWVRRAHSGSVHLYLLYGAAGVLTVLIIASTLR